MTSQKSAGQSDSTACFWMLNVEMYRIEHRLFFLYLQSLTIATELNRYLFAITYSSDLLFAVVNNTVMQLFFTEQFNLKST